MRVVLRDEFGRVQELTRDYYRSPSLLRPGLHQFRYSVGSPLTRMDSLPWSYRGVTGTAEHRVGITEALTLGVTGGFSNHSTFGGMDLAARLPIGEVEVDVRGSRAHGVAGVAGSALFLVRSGRVSGQATVRAFSSSYQEARPRDPIQDPLVDGAVSVNGAVGRGISIGAQYLWWRGQKSERGEVASTVSVSLPAGLGLTIRTSRRIETIKVWSSMAMLTIPIGARTSASVSADTNLAGSAEGRVSLQQGLPLGPGAGYQLQWQQGQTSAGSAVLQYQGGPARIEVRQDQWANRHTTAINVAGAVVALHEGVFWTRPITDAFALVKVGGFGGVRAYMSNQYVGRTNENGELVVPSLASYQTNRISIDDRDLPMLAELRRTDWLLAPGLRGAGVISFPVRRFDPTEVDLLTQLQALEPPPGDGAEDADSTRGPAQVSGRFVLDTVNRTTPAEGQATAHWPSGDERTRVGQTGAFLFNQAVTGTHQVDVTVGRESFTCPLVVPASATGTRAEYEVGTVSCQSIQRR